MGENLFIDARGVLREEQISIGGVVVKRLKTTDLERTLPI